MASKIVFFPVGNGDQTLITLDDSDKTSILIDCNIRQSAEGDDDDLQCDVASELRERLHEDENGRPYVDVFLLSHPDQDHCRGVEKHFHLAPLDTYVDTPKEGEEKKIVIREMWSSPMSFRRASKNFTLSDDAKAFHKEARRRVKLFGENGIGAEGDKILIIGEDEKGRDGKSKTDGLEEILVKIDEEFSLVNSKDNDLATMLVLGPLPPQDEEDEEDEEDKLASNRSSIVIKFSIKHKNNDTDPACLFLSGGDAGVYVWEKLWEKHKGNRHKLAYDVLLTPHHCSWHSLSHDSWKDSEDPQVCVDARKALSQANSDATLIASSNSIEDDDNDPPCWGAKLEYEEVVKESGDHGEFLCLEEYPDSKGAPEPYEIEIHGEGSKRPDKRAVGIAGIATRSTGEKLGHG